MSSDTQIDDVDTEIIPDEDDDSNSTYVACQLGVPGKDMNAANVILEGEASDDAIATALLKTALAVAQMHSSGAWMALQQRLVTS
jgi:hypothetical protein